MNSLQPGVLKHCTRSFTSWIAEWTLLRPPGLTHSLTNCTTLLKELNLSAPRSTAILILHQGLRETCDAFRMEPGRGSINAGPLPHLLLASGMKWPSIGGPYAQQSALTMEPNG